jgi:hypothetical protein
MTDQELLELVKLADPLAREPGDRAAPDSRVFFDEIVNQPRQQRPKRRGWTGSRPALAVLIVAAVVLVPAALAFHRQMLNLFAAPSVPSQLSGTYTATITGQHPAALNGTWTLSFSPQSEQGGVHGTYTRAHNGKLVATGGFQLSYSANVGTLLLLRDIYGPQACADNGAVGSVYDIEFLANGIKLTLNYDPCAQRRALLAAAHTFIQR